MIRRVWAISDIHLPHGTMDAYGEIWKDHDVAILENVKKVVSEGDVLLIAGDSIDASNSEIASPHLHFLSEIPCRVVLCPGNHDSWLCTIERELLPSNVTCLDGRCIRIGDLVIGGTMFWCFNNAFPWEGHIGIMKRLQKHQTEELRKLRTTLELLSQDSAKTKILMLHFPPITDKAEENVFTRMIEESGVSHCVYGHVHGQIEFVAGCNSIIHEIRYILTSADYLQMKPIHVCDFIE